MPKGIETEIVIQASPEKIWSILTNTKEYPNWNPFIKKIEGVLQVGERLEVEIHPENSSKMTFKPLVLVNQKNRILQWKGKFLIRGLFDGTHTFELQNNNDGSTTFKQNEQFEGILVRFFNLENTILGFKKMNKALKILSEQ